MFLGEYQHMLDAKGRVILPVRFRGQLERGGVIARTVDRCLGLYPPEEWEQVANHARERARLGQRERQAARVFFAGATDVVPDKQGRVAIPQHLREYAGLERDVVVTGAHSRIEIWDQARWVEVSREAEASLGDAADLDDFGI